GRRPRRAARPSLTIRRPNSPMRFSPTGMLPGRTADSSERTRDVPTASGSISRDQRRDKATAVPTPTSVPAFRPSAGPPTDSGPSRPDGGKTGPPRICRIYHRIAREGKKPQRDRRPVVSTPLQVHTIVSMPFQENTYVVWHPGRDDALVIDPGLEPDLI